MMGSFLTRILIMAVGYLYPAYECYKAVENQEIPINQLKFWCQYWILIALFTVCERVGDHTISWLPLYGEAKVAFLIYLWHPKTMGTGYVYGSFISPYLAKHEKEIDLNMLKMGKEVGLLRAQVWGKALSYVKCSFLDVLQYINSQSLVSKVQLNQQSSQKGL